MDDALVQLALAAVVGLLSLGASAHVLLHKQSPRAAAGWIGLAWLAPVVGPALYLVLGINRIHRKAVQLRPRSPSYRAMQLSPEPSDESLACVSASLLPLVRLVRRTTGHRLLEGNAVTLLDSGDALYPEMLRAIAGAERSVTLLTYIFDRDEAGLRFVDALGRAVARGVEVRVLVDALGLRYSYPNVLGSLREVQVPCARYLPATPWSVAFLNLRNHRKVCVIDGRIGFTGGTNIRQGHVLDAHPEHPTRDLHARVEGPVVAQLQRVFARDWGFTTGEELEGPGFFPDLSAAGPVCARVIPDGPDEDLDAFRLTLLGAISVARTHIQVVTPYFLPDEAVLIALEVAALRGVCVDIVLPERSNLRFVDRASRPDLKHLIDRGCRVWRVAAPFDHTKLLVVDEAWTLMGSGNWDPRSLRLNFEMQLEGYDPELAEAAGRAVDDRLARARPMTADEIARRTLGARLLDGAARLFSPYL